MKKMIRMRAGIAAVFLVSLILALAMPKTIGYFYDRYAREHVQYPDAEKGSALLTDVQTKYETGQIIRAMAKGVQESIVNEYQSDYYEFAKFAVMRKYVSDTALEKEFEGICRWGEFYGQNAEEFCHDFPDALEGIQAQLEKQIEGGLYHGVYDMVNVQNLLNVTQVYFFYEDAAANESLSTVLWRLYFGEGSDVVILVNPDDYGILGAFCRPYITGTDGERLLQNMGSLMGQRQLNLEACSEQWELLAACYGADRMEIYDMDSIVDMPVRSGSEEHWVLQEGFLIYEDSGTERQVPFVNEAVVQWAVDGVDLDYPQVVYYFGPCSVFYLSLFY